MDSSFEFQIFKPKGRLSNHIQGVWSASVPSRGVGEITRWLHGDAGSGILFNLSGEICLDDIQFTSGVIMLPVSKQAHSITLSPGSQLVGLRFHPAIGFGVLGQHYDEPTALAIEDDTSLALDSLCGQLMNTQGHYARIAIIYRWLIMAMDFSDVTPSSLMQALDFVQKERVLGKLSEEVPLSQRQLERQFKRWMGMSPKQYQRIIRVKQTLNFLKANPDADLVLLALNNGFTDQSHMTRELKQIAKITPGQYSRLVACC